MSVDEMTVQHGESFGSFSRVVPSLLFLVLLFFLNFTSRVIFSPLLPVIEGELDISHATSGSFFFFISSGYFLSLFLSGFVSRRLTHKKTIVLSALGSGLVLLLAGLCVTLFQLRLALFFLGLTAGLYLPSGLATIAMLVPPSYSARGVAVHELAPNAAFVAAPLLCEVMLHVFSWRHGIMLLGVTLLFAGTFYLFFAEGNRESGQPPDLRLMAFYLRQPEFWLLVMLFSLAICSTVGIYTMLPLFLVSDQGMETGRANGLVSLSRVVALAMPVLAGWLGDLFGNRRLMTLVLFAAGIATVFLGRGSDELLVVMVIVQSMIAVCFFPSGFAVLSRLAGRGKENIGVSLVIPLAFLSGGGVMPVMIGFVGDRLSIGAGILGAGILMIIGGAVSFALYYRLGGKRR